MKTAAARDTALAMYALKALSRQAFTASRDGTPFDLERHALQLEVIRRALADALGTPVEHEQPRTLN